MLFFAMGDGGAAVTIDSRTALPFAGRGGLYGCGSPFETPQAMIVGACGTGTIHLGQAMGGFVEN